MSKQFQERTVSLRDIGNVIRRNLFGMIISVILCVEFAVLALLYLPTKYKSTTTVDIKSSYFGSPLGTDILGRSQDPAELKAQREGLLKVSLSDEFIDSLGDRLGIYARGRSKAVDERVLREGLRRRIDYFSTGPTSFQLAATAGNADEAKNIVEAVLHQFTTTLIQARYTALIGARDAIQAQVEFLGRALEDLGKVQKAKQLRDRLADLDADIASLQQKYTSFHPDLQNLESQATSVRSRLQHVPQVSDIFKQDEVAKAFLVTKSQQPIQDIYQDLLRKLSYLNITLKMEGTGNEPYYLSVLEKPSFPLGPIFPNPLNIIALGLVAGAVLGVLQGVYFELRRQEHLVPRVAAHALDMPLLGTLPILPEGRQVLRLEGRRKPLELPRTTEGAAA